MPSPRVTPPSRGSARRVVLAGAATLLLAAVLAVAGSILPPADQGSAYASAIVALELARTPAEVTRAMGVTPEVREVLVRVVWIDFAFLLVYPLLQLAIVAFLTRRRLWRGVALLLSLAMIAGDALENRALLGILAAPETSVTLLGGLVLWTTVKWSALFAAALLTAALLVARGGASRALALVPLATAVVGFVGLASAARRPLVELAGSFGIGLMWAAVLVMALFGLRRARGR